MGATGSGKTTQLPQYLYEAGFVTPRTMVGVTQPRRVAAITVAERVASEMGTKVGDKVGYSIRFDDKTTRGKTLVKYMTDGMLLKELAMDPLLSSYGVIVLDEAHERTLHTDILLALLKDLQQRRQSRRRKSSGEINTTAKTEHRKGKEEPKRKKLKQNRTGVKKQLQSQLGDSDPLTAGLPPLKLIIMSATLDAERFSKYFNSCPVLNVPGRTFPVDVLYTPAPERDVMDAVVIAVLQLHLKQEETGDILVFLTGTASLPFPY